MQVHVPHDQEREDEQNVMFNCDTHTSLSAPPDEFVLKHPQGTLAISIIRLSHGIGKDQLSPELMERQSTRNAVKRYNYTAPPLSPQPRASWSPATKPTRCFLNWRQWKSAY